MSEDTPCVSLGLPVYNGEKHLEETLDALLKQTFTDFEVVIADNASTDRTQEICEAYAARDQRIRYYRNPQNLGAGRNFNRVFELARGKYFKWTAHDDLCDPSFLERCVEVLNRDPSVVLCYSWTRLIDPDGADLGDYEFNGKYTASSPSTHARFRDIVIPYHWCFQIFGLIRTAALKQTSCMGSYLSADRVLLAHLSLLGRFHEIPEYLFFSKRYPEQSGTMMVRPLAYMAWYNPQNRGRVLLPHWQEYIEYFKAVQDVRLTTYDRIRCYIYLLNLTNHGKRARYLLKDLLVAGALSIGRKVTVRPTRHKAAPGRVAAVSSSTD
jgi:glycosyltransferase involved in cell wall biosynthesis